MVCIFNAGVDIKGCRGFQVAAFTGTLMKPGALEATGFLLLST
jgi:hypothetical protein